MLRRRAGRPVLLLLLGRRHASSSSPSSLDHLLGKRLRETAQELSVEVLPALKVLSESLGLLHQSPALRSWSASDWLVGLSVLAQYKTQQRATGLHNEAHKKPLVVDQNLLPKLLRYVRVCDAVYASSVAAFCDEAGVDRERVLRAHPGGVVSPRCVIVADHEHRELVLVIRGTASLLDFCTDLCLQNEPFQDGQGHRGMVHAATWLVHHLGNDLKKLSAEYPDYKLVATGHSLGAAVAAMTAMQLREQFPDIHCYGFGTPACVTRELADGSYDLVTSVVNGYDCVPRLHQHSLLKLQDELSRFNWRAVLKEMVADEIHKQKQAVEKQQRAKLEEVQAALRMDHLQLKQRTSEATAKLDEVKRVAASNIKEFASDVDSLLADKLDAAFSIFKTDKLSLEHVSLIKNLMNLEDVKKGDSVWWKHMNETVPALERLTTSAKKPEELERVLVELKAVLQMTSASTKTLLKGGDHDSESTQLQLFRSKLDDIIDKTRTSLKAQISEQVSKVSTAVTSNVKDYVDTIKEETKALSTIVQEELDDVAETISQNLPFIVGLKSGNTSDDQSSNQSASHSNKERSREVFADADPSQRIEGETNEEAEKQWEKDEKKSEEEMLCHDPLFPPGRILYLNRVMAPGPSPEIDDGIGIKTLETDRKRAHVVEFVEVATDEFGRVVLSNRMLLDHLCTDYERVLQSQAQALESAPNGEAYAVVPNGTYKKN